MISELRRLAENAWRNCRLEEALTLHLQLLRFLARSRSGASDWSEDDHLALSRTAYLATLFGKVEEANLLLAGCSELYRQQGMQLDADRVTLQRVQLVLGDGRSAEADEILYAMRPTLGDIFDQANFETTEAGMIRWELGRQWNAPGDTHALFAQFYLDLGRLAEFHGDFRLAILVLRRGLYHAAGRFSSNSERFAAPMRLALAESLIECGDLRSAGGQLAHANLLIQASSEPGHSVRLKELWAAIHILAGEFGACIDQLREVAVFLREQGLGSAALNAQLNLAYAQIFLLQTVEAQSALTWVFEEAKQRGQLCLQRRAKQLMALAERRLNRVAPRQAPSTTSMRAGARPSRGVSGMWRPLPAMPTGSFVGRFEESATFFRALLESDDADGAERYWAYINETFGRSDSELMRVRLLSLEAEFLAYHGRYQQARSMLRQALPMTRASGLKTELSLTLALAAECAAKTGHDDNAAAYIVECQKLTDEIAQSMPVPERLMFLLGQTAIEEDWLRVQIERLATSTNAPQSAALWDEVNSILERTEAGKELLVREVLGRTSAGILECDRRRECPGNRAVITFVVLPECVLTVLYTREDFSFRIRSVGRLRIREFVSRWHVSESSPDDRHHCLLEAGRDLAEALALPALLQDLPAAVSELVFVPDDSLYGYPFAALRDAEGYLIERYAISVAHRRPRSPVAAAVSLPLLAGVMCGAPKYPVLRKVNELGWLTTYFRNS